ncbi:TPA: hypothetical protein N0F65_009008, partial [Lagenidium giganteum]
HWLWAFYHVFEKFPVRGLFECEDKAGRLRLHLVVRRGDQANHEARRAHSTRLRTLMERMMEELHDLNKPLCQLDLAGTMTFHDRVDSSVLANQLVCGLIRTLITFLPVQICRAADNRLTTMIDGLSPDQLVDSATETVADVARSIRFGVLSVLLESWPGKCVVVTSMGKQSTGKSYLLNHLTGASFATSGARCTDGAWLSVRIVSTDVLLVVVDFEGLGSFERTEQEDVLLSVLNSAISHFTIFRIEMRFDKDIDVMFSSFQKGVRLLRGEAQLFQGCLCMSIKDVNVNDQKGVLDEIRAKFRKLVATNKRDNFLSGMYCGKLELTCSPPTGTWGYHRALANTKHCLDKRLRDHPNLPYSSGKAFLDLLRLVIAKISVLDWTGVDESARQIRQTDVQRQLVGLLRCGCLVARDGDITERRLRKTPYTAATEAGVLCLHVLSSSYPTKATEWQRVAGDRGINFDALLDYDVDLGPLVTTVASTLDWEGLRDELERLHALFGGLCRRGRDNTDVLKPTHQSHFDAFLSFVLCRRVANVEHWVKEHEARAGAITDVWRTFEYQYVRRLLAAFARCQHPCHACQLGCMNAVNHPRDFAHDCRTSHHCNGYCEYCLEATEEDEHVDIKNRRYAAGETSVAEMCNIYCSSVGRGHVHFLPCNQFASDCVYDGASDGRRHCQLDLVPPFNGELDEVLHTTYWASIGWEDPCVDFEERRKFEMCAMQCDDPEHRRLEKPSVCVLPAWHEKAVNDGLGTRFAYVGGHKFICSHASATDRLHHVFVLDSSGSMRGNPWHHLCRAVKRYLEERLDGHFKDDAVSVITFADRASVVFEASPILSAVKKVTSLSCTGGGTEFEKGLAKANEVLSRVVNVRSSTPVLIFLSDGRPTDERRSNQLADAMKRHFAKYDLRCFVVAFGDADDKALKRFATRLGGSVRHALNGNELRKTFVSISKSLGARAGLVPNQAGEATTTSSRTS